MSNNEQKIINIEACLSNRIAHYFIINNRENKGDIRFFDCVNISLKENIEKNNENANLIDTLNKKFRSLEDFDDLCLFLGLTVETKTSNIVGLKEKATKNGKLMIESLFNYEDDKHKELYEKLSISEIGSIAQNKKRSILHY